MSGDVYVVALGYREEGEPVLAVAGPISYGDLGLPIHDFELETEDAEWMEGEFEAGRVEVVSSFQAIRDFPHN